MASTISTLTFLVSVLLAVSNLQTVLASVYPTIPVSGTVYRAGRRELVTWIDSRREPHLDELGVLVIDLYTADGVSSFGYAV